MKKTNLGNSKIKMGQGDTVPGKNETDHALSD